MANDNIDNLNFKVILDDADFDAQIDRDIELAKKLNVQLSTLLNVKSQVVSKNIMGDATKAAKLQKATADAAAAQEKLRAATVNTATAQERLATAAANAANAQERLKQSQMRTEQLAKRITAQTERQNKAYQAQGRILNELKGYAVGYLSIHGASQLLSSLVRVTGEFELQKTTLAAMLGDLNKAENVITRIQALAVESPFQFKELTTYAKQLSAFSVPAEELFETTKMLADVSAGLGVGMDRIVLAYGQVRSAAFLRGQEVRQFTEAGIPILEELAKQFSELEGRAVSAGEVFDKISARLVPFEMVAKVFKDMTSEGGKFYQMQEIQAETLRGKISNLKDAYEMMLNEIGSVHSDKLKRSVDWVKGLMQNWESIGRQLTDIIKLFGAYKVAVGLLQISDTIAKFGGLANAIKKTAAAQALMNSALMTNPYIAIGTAITAIVLAIGRHRKALDGAARAQMAYNARVQELSKIERERINETQRLISVIQDETQATIEREAALISLKKSYPSIFEQYDLESLKLADILQIKRQISEEDAKQRKVAAYGAIGAQQGRIKSLTARGASGRHKEEAWQMLYQMEKDYLSQYVLPDMVAGLKDLSDEALQSALNEAFRKSKYDFRGIEQFDNIPTTADFYEDLYAAIQSEISRRQNIKPAEGWRKKVQDALTGLGLDEGSSFGLWAKDTTQSVEYVEDLIKRYKELGEQAKLISSFDKEQVARLEQNKAAIEAVAKELGIDLSKITNEEADNTEDAYKRSYRAAKEFYDALRNWATQDFNIAGEGIDFKFNKITADLNTNLAKVDLKAQKLKETLAKIDIGDATKLEQVKKLFEAEFGVGAWDKFFNEYLKKGTEAIDALAQKEKDASKRTAAEKIRSMSSAYTKELLESKNISLTDMSDKTATQLRELVNRIKETRAEVQKEADRIIVGIAAGKYKNNEFALWQMLLEVLEQLDIKIADTEKEVDNSVGKKMVRSLGLLSSALSEVGNTIVSLGETTANGTLARFGETLQDYGNFAADMTSSIKSFAEEVKDIDFENKTFKDLSESAQAGAIGIFATAIGFFYGKIVDEINYAYEQQKLLNEASLEYQKILLQQRREKYQTVFGSNDFNLFLENAEILTEAREKYEQTLGEFNKTKFQGFKLGGGMAFANQSLVDIMDLLSKEQGWDLYKENGELNIAALEAYYDAYSNRLTKKQRLLVEELIANGNAVTDAASEQASYLSSLFSGVADDIADSFIESFKESGQAALDYGEIMDGIATQIAKDLIKAALLQEVFTDEVVKNASDRLAAGDAAGTLAIVNEAMEQAQALAPAFQQMLNGLQPYFQMGQEGEEQNLSEGVKGITEDTANLLASYLNAIRADVSFGKAQWAQMNIHLQQISNLLTGFSAPSLMEYQAQIAANTFNAAQNTRDILSRIDMVLTDSNEGTAIRTLGV